MDVTNSQPKKMGQPLKFGTVERRKEMWQAVCDHVASGLSMGSFALCDADTIFTYADRFPEDCPLPALREAQRKSIAFWEKIGLAGATGKIEGFNAASWIFNMKNRAGWSDKIQNVMLGPNGGALQHEVKVDGVVEHQLTAEHRDMLKRLIRQVPDLVIDATLIEKETDDESK